MLDLSCDLIVAVEDSKFGLPEVKRGLVAVGGGLFRLPRRIAYHLAMELALTGELHPAQRMHALGRVNSVAKSGHALQVALDFAQRIAANAPLALVATKRIVQRAGEWSKEQACLKQRELAAAALCESDAREVRASAEKRAPRWHGA